MRIASILVAGLCVVGCTNASDDPSGDGDGGDGDGEVSNDITIRVDGSASLIAFQDGAGVWQALSEDGGAYHAHTDAGRFGVLRACDSGDFTTWSVTYWTPADGSELRYHGCVDPELTRDMTGAVAATAGDRIEIASAWNATGSESGRFDLRLPDQAGEVFATAEAADGSALHIARVPFAAGSANVMQDLDLAHGAAATRKTVAMSNTQPDESLTIDSYIVTAEASFFLPNDHAANQTASALGYWDVPASVTRSDDRIFHTVRANAQLPDSHGYQREVDLGSGPVALPDRVTIADPAVTAAEMTFTVPAFDGVFTATVFGQRVVAQAYATPRWLEDSETVALPVTLAVSAWQPAWDLSDMSSWNAGTWGDSRGVSAFGPLGTP